MNIKKRYEKASSTEYDRIRPYTKHTDKDKDTDKDADKEKDISARPSELILLLNTVTTG